MLYNCLIELNKYYKNISQLSAKSKKNSLFLLVV